MLFFAACALMMLKHWLISNEERIIVPCLDLKCTVKISFLADSAMSGPQRGISPLTSLTKNRRKTKTKCEIES